MSSFVKVTRNFFITGDSVIDKNSIAYMYLNAVGFDKARVYCPKKDKVIEVHIPLYFSDDFDPGETIEILK